ncbi:MAG: TetR/AcrR family transcriptional regulator [Bacteroidota bacterium]
MLATIKPLTSRKQEILEAAQALFSRKGYTDASMRDLAEALGIEPASLYSHFKSKEDILWEIAIRCAKAFNDGQEPIFSASLTPEIKLRNMIDRHIELMIDNINASAIFFREWHHLSKERHDDYAQMIIDYEQRFVQVIEEGMKAGVFKASVRPKFITSALLASINWMHKWYRPEGSMTISDIQQHMHLLLLDGLQS